MAITTYAELQTAVGNWLARSDLTADIHDFITLAEGYFNDGISESDPPLRCREMEVLDDLTPTNGVCTLPADYLQFRSVTALNSPVRELDYITPDAANQRWSNGTAGLSAEFTIIGESLYTYPGSSVDVRLHYWQKIPALSDANTSNWLLARSPQLYLRGALMQAADFIKNTEEQAKQQGLTRSLVAGLNRSNMLANYSRAGLTIRGMTP
jgi:hypothetical protein